MRRILLAVIPALLIPIAAAVPTRAQVGRPISFDQDVLPIFRAKCAFCHSNNPKGQLQLASFEQVMKGGAHGKVIIPGDPDRSLLIQMVEGRVKPQMPPNSAPLSPRELTILRGWVAAGAVKQAQAQAPATPARPGAAIPPAAPDAPFQSGQLTVLTPKEGATVREKVLIQVPRDSVPADGFISVSIDGWFKAAIAPRDPEILDDEGLPADTPVQWIWDTSEPLHTDTTRANANQPPAEGPHTIDVVAFNSSGTEVDRTTLQVNLKNTFDYDENKPIPLYYGGRIGTQYLLMHSVDLEATQITDSTPRAGGANNPPPVGAAKLTHKEESTNLVSLEDVSPRTSLMFWRERRESPMTVFVNGGKSVVQFDGSSVYYAMNRRGQARVSKSMERQKREPIVNPMVVPGGPLPFGQTFNTTVHVNLGAYIPATLAVPNIEARVDGFEWAFGEPCARLKADYLAGKAQVDVNSLSIRNGELDVQQGTTTVWFSLLTKRVLRAQHEITGTLVVENAGQLDSSGMGGMMGGDAGMMGYGGMGGAGMMGSGGPGMMGAGGYGSPFGGAMGGAMDSGDLDSGSGGPGMAGPGGYGGMMGSGGMMGAGGPGGMMGYGGMGSGSMMGSGGMMGYGGEAGVGGGTGVAKPQKFHIKLQVETRLEEPDRKK